MRFALLTARARTALLCTLDITEGAKINVAEATAKYGALFHNMVWLGLASALVALAVTPLMRRWMRAAG